MQKLLFLDRDGCIIAEPQPDQQVDSLEKLEFVPGVIFALARLARESDFEFVLVTNQDGLGSPAFPENTFWPAHEKMLRTLEGEGIRFRTVHIDRSFAQEQAPTRKPGTAMLTEYLGGAFDLAASYVVGDRLTDVQLAHNLGARAVLLQNPTAQKVAQARPETMPTESRSQYDPTGAEGIELVADTWEQIYEHLRRPPRRVQHRRSTRETDITVGINLDGVGESDIRTGLHFFDHMLDQLARHGSFDLQIEAQGDLHVDEHHTIEDTAITLGEAFALALGDKRGLERYGFCLPMDDALAQVAVDFGGRPWLVWQAGFRRERVGDWPTELFFHFFKSFSDAARCNLNIRVDGDNEHHKIEAIFKAFARALKMAVKRDPHSDELPSTKGAL